VNQEVKNDARSQKRKKVLHDSSPSTNKTKTLPDLSNEREGSGTGGENGGGGEERGVQSLLYANMMQRVEGARKTYQGGKGCCGPQGQVGNE